MNSLLLSPWAIFRNRLNLKSMWQNFFQHAVSLSYVSGSERKESFCNVEYQRRICWAILRQWRVFKVTKLRVICIIFQSCIWIFALENDLVLARNGNRNYFRKKLTFWKGVEICNATWKAFPFYCALFQSWLFCVLFIGNENFVINEKL